MHKPAELTRRRLLTMVPVAMVGAAWPRWEIAEPAVDDSIAQKNVAFAGDKGPQLNRALIQEFVKISHFDLNKVQSMLTQHPTLLNASWDWGGGDFETGLGAASHVGNRSIALHFLSLGARPDIFTATMLGHLSMIKGLLETYPDLINSRGPHGLTLLHHARKGGDAAVGVVRLLESLGAQ